MKLVKLTTLSLLLTLSLWPTSAAQLKTDEYWYPIEPYRISIDTSNSEVRNLISRWEAIGAGLSTTKDISAGTYDKSGYRGYFLRWSPENGFSFVYHSEGLSIIDFSYGSVRVASDGIVFQPERDLRETFRDHKLKLPRKWIPITVKSRSYLVPEEELQDFGDFFGGFGVYNDFNGPCCEFSPFFVKDRVSSGQREAMSLPAQYQEFIKQPIEAEITFVGKKKLTRNYSLEGELYGHAIAWASLTPVTINAGNADGVVRKMLFRLRDQFGPQYLKVTQVWRDRSSGVVIRDVDRDDRERFSDYDPQSTKRRTKSFPPVRVGTKITTSPISGS